MNQQKLQSKAMEMDHTGKKKKNNVPLYSNKQKRDKLHPSCMERMKEANAALRRWSRRISSSRQPGLQGKILARIGAEARRREEKEKTERRCLRWNCELCSPNKRRSISWLTKKSKLEYSTSHTRRATKIPEFWREARLQMNCNGFYQQILFKQ